MPFRTRTYAVTLAFAALAACLDRAHPFPRIVRPTPDHGLIFVRLSV